MARGSKNEVTEDSKRIIDACRQLLKNSGITIDEFFDSSGLSNNYWYKRMRYEAPLNTSDVEHIASTFGLTSLDIYTRALGSKAAREYGARNLPQIPDDLVDRIAAHPEDFDVAALTDQNKEAEMNGGEDR